MVRFSDLLGGGRDNDKHGDAPPQGTVDAAPDHPTPTDPYAALGEVSDGDGEPDEAEVSTLAESAESLETAEEVLAALMEYAEATRETSDTSAASAAHAAFAALAAAAPEEVDEPSGVDLDQPVADDLLPRAPRRKSR
jgi:hypothetical protein